MLNFSNDEMNLMCIYNTGSRDELINELISMREHLKDSETELHSITDAVIKKLETINDDMFVQLKFIPDFCKENIDSNMTFTSTCIHNSKKISPIICEPIS